MRKPHYHKDDKGFLHRCYHASRNQILTWSFWLGLTMGFPLEHLLWEHVWPFYVITKFLGLH